MYACVSVPLFSDTTVGVQPNLALIYRGLRVSGVKDSKVREMLRTVEKIEIFFNPPVHGGFYGGNMSK